MEACIATNGTEQEREQESTRILFQSYIVFRSKEYGEQRVVYRNGHFLFLLLDVCKAIQSTNIMQMWNHDPDVSIINFYKNDCFTSPRFTYATTYEGLCSKINGSVKDKLNKYCIYIKDKILPQFETLKNKFSEDFQFKNIIWLDSERDVQFYKFKKFEDLRFIIYNNTIFFLVRDIAKFIQCKFPEKYISYTCKNFYYICTRSLYRKSTSEEQKKYADGLLQKNFHALFKEDVLLENKYISIINHGSGLRLISLQETCRLLYKRKHPKAEDLNQLFLLIMKGIKKAEIKDTIEDVPSKEEDISLKEKSKSSEIADTNKEEESQDVKEEIVPPHDERSPVAKLTMDSLKKSENQEKINAIPPVDKPKNVEEIKTILPEGESKEEENSVAPQDECTRKDEAESILSPEEEGKREEKGESAPHKEECTTAGKVEITLSEDQFKTAWRLFEKFCTTKSQTDLTILLAYDRAMTNMLGASFLPLFGFTVEQLKAMQEQGCEEKREIQSQERLNEMLQGIAPERISIT